MCKSASRGSAASLAIDQAPRPVGGKHLAEDAPQHDLGLATNLLAFEEHDAVTHELGFERIDLRFVVRCAR